MLNVFFIFQRKSECLARQRTSPIICVFRLSVVCIFPWKLQKLVTGKVIGFRGLFKFLTQSISNSYRDTYSYSAFIIACHHIVKTWYKVFHIRQPDHFRQQDFRYQIYPILHHKEAAKSESVQNLTVLKIFLYLCRFHILNYYFIVIYTT